METITINGEEYIKKSLVKHRSIDQELACMQYVIVRTSSAGVFSGYLGNRNGGEVTLINARRLWYWKGAASLSQLAVDGVNCPDGCKFPCEVPFVTVLGAIEIIRCSDKAKDSIESVKVWTA